MKRKKLAALLTSVVLIGVIAVGATLAYFTDKDEAENVITMGHVDIELTEPSFPEDKEITNVLPGDQIEKDPTVTVKEGSEDAYIRVKMSVTGLADEYQEALLAKNADGTYQYLDIDLSDWRESADGYFYYIGTADEGQSAGVLKAGQSVKLFEHVTIPGSWKNDMADESFNIAIFAEAIQAENFEPSTVNDVYGWFEGTTAVTAETYTAPAAAQ